MAEKLTIVLYRGHTHGELALLQTSPIAGFVGRWCREHLADKEFIPKGWKWDPVRHMRVFNPYPQWKVTRVFCRYDKALQHMFLPIAFCDPLKNDLEAMGVEVKELPINDYPLKKIDEHIKMRPGFTDRPWQVEPIKKCSEPVPGMKGLNLQTGKGKTYSAVRTALNLGYATMIIVPGLVNQWIDDIAEYTTAKIGVDIYKIEGFDTFAFLAKNQTYRPTIFVASTRTMQMFANNDDGYEVLPWNYRQFFKEYGIGTKIVDECHKQFHANTLMDLQTNVPYNIYLSATFDQTSTRVREIFDRVFPRESRIGSEEYDKYVSVIWMNYYGEIQEKRCQRAKGYMHSLYEHEMMKCKSRLDAHVNQYIVPLLNQYYINQYERGHKCLIFCSTIEYVDALVERLQVAYPNIKVRSYTAATSRSVLEEADMVVSTIGKASTGLDWKGLRCCLNTVSVRSSVLTSQMLGRLRKINGAQLNYIDMCDNNLSAQLRHAEYRRQDLRRMAAKFCECNGMCDMNPRCETFVGTVTC